MCCKCSKHTHYMHQATTTGKCNKSRFHFLKSTVQRGRSTTNIAKRLATSQTSTCALSLMVWIKPRRMSHRCLRWLNQCRTCGGFKLTWLVSGFPCMIPKFEADTYVMQCFNFCRCTSTHLELKGGKKPMPSLTYTSGRLPATPP